MTKNDPSIFENAIVISPDFGAMDRARYYAEIIGCDVGVFYKRRDLSKVVDGKNPIVAHTYLGNDVQGKNVLIVDDMIASGGSVINLTKKLREMHANKISVTVTFALFTDGFEAFQKAHDEGILDYIYTTNVSYIPKSITDLDWVFAVDMAPLTAQIIDSMDKKEPLTKYFNQTKETIKKVQNSIK